MQRAITVLQILALTCVSLCFHSCQAQASVTVDGELHTPLGSIHFGATASGTLGGGGAPLANRCVEFTFTDADGENVGSSVAEADSDGNVSTAIPDGAVAFQAAVVDCPEEDADGDGDEPSASGSVTGVVGNAGFALPVPTLFAFGAPLKPDLSPGSVNFVYSMTIVADKVSTAESVLASVLSKGVGARVPAGVTVHQFTTLSVDASEGLRVLHANPSEFLSWNLTVNGGSFHADLQTNSLHYPQGSWNVVEVLVPASALDIGVLPGATYVNDGEVSYRIASSPELRADALQLSITN